MVETGHSQLLQFKSPMDSANLTNIQNAEDSHREFGLGSGRQIGNYKSLPRRSSDDKLQKYAAYAQQLQSYYNQEMPFNVDYDKIKYPTFTDCIFDQKLHHRALPQDNTQILEYLKLCRKNEDHIVHHSNNQQGHHQASHTTIGVKQRASSQTRSRKSLVPPSHDSKVNGDTISRNKKVNSQVSLKPPSTSHQASRKTFESSQKDFNKYPQSSIHGLKFDSNFECGNLDTVREKEPNVYDIIVRNDSNSAGHVHWFYFRVKTPQVFKTQMPTVKCNILNMTKRDSLFEQGMKITILSKKSGQGWTQGGNNITYTKSLLTSDINYLNSKQQPYYCLSFEYKFEHADDEVFFSTTIPYTYSNMQRHLLALNQLKELKDNKMFEITSIGKSNGKLDMPLVKIRSPKITPKNGVSQSQDLNEPDETKPVIFIIGRQHPGETLSSFIIHGLINFLLTPNQAVQQLREMFEFWIMPIANPDGVVLGNYRCNLQGKDLNRCFQYFNDEEYGGTYSSVQECECIQNYMNANIFTNQKIVGKKVSSTQTHAGSILQGMGVGANGESRIKLFLDIHTHSSQRGIFTYAPCAQIQEQLKVRQFPQILDEISQYFRLASCKYQSEKAKKNCARLAFVRDYKAEYSYTIETSSYAYVEKKTNQTYQLKMTDLLMFGKQIVVALSKLFITDPQINGGNISSINNQIEIKMPENQSLGNFNIQSGPRFLGYNMPLDFGLRMQWRPPTDIQKICKQVIAKFSQSKLTNKQNSSISNTTKRSNLQLKQLAAGSVPAIVNRVINPSGSSGKLEIRLSDSHSQQQNFPVQAFSNEVTLLDHSAIGTQKQYNIFAPTKTLQGANKEPFKQLKSSVFQMNYISDNFILNEDIQQMINSNPTSATNEFLQKILKSKDGKNNFNNDGILLHKNQILRNNNLIAYSQKQRHYNATDTAQSISAQKQDYGILNNILADNDKNFSFPTPLDDEIMLANSMPLGSTAKSREFLSAQIKKFQNHKLKQTQNGGRARFMNFQQVIQPIIQTPQAISSKHSNHTFRQDNQHIVNAFPELNQIVSPQPLQMVVPAKIYKKNYQAYKTSYAINEISDRITRMILPSNPSIGEKSIEDEISKSQSSLDEIEMADGLPPSMMDMHRIIQVPKSVSKSASPNKYHKENNLAINRQTTQSETAGIINEQKRVHPILKTLPMGQYNTNKDQNQGGSVMKGRNEGPHTGQLYSKLEMIEQKSKDFKEYLKIQLQEVHENHMKEKYPYKRAIGNHSQQMQHMSSDRIITPQLNQSKEFQQSRFQIQDQNTAQNTKIALSDFINHTSKAAFNGGSFHPDQYDNRAGNTNPQDEALSKKVQSQNLINQKTVRMLNPLEQPVQQSKVSPIKKVPRVMIETIEQQNKIKSAMLSSTEMLSSPSSNNGGGGAFSTKNRKNNGEEEAHEGVIDAIKLQNMQKKNLAQQKRLRQINKQEIKPLNSQPLFQTYNSTTISTALLQNNNNSGVANIVYNMAIDEPGNFQAYETPWLQATRGPAGNGGVSLLSMQGINKKDLQSQLLSSAALATQKTTNSATLAKNMNLQPKVQIASSRQEMVTGVGIMPSPPKKKTRQEPLPIDGSQMHYKGASPKAEQYLQQRKLQFA